MRRDLTDEVKVARLWLLDWGKWHKRTHSLPPRARLATPGEGVMGSEESIEVTHSAVIALRAKSFGCYTLVKEMYEHQHDTPREVFERIGERIGVNSMSGFYKARNRAETEVFHLRTAAADMAETQYLEGNKKYGTTC